MTIRYSDVFVENLIEQTKEKQVFFTQQDWKEFGSDKKDEKVRGLFSFLSSEFDNGKGLIFPIEEKVMYDGYGSVVKQMISTIDNNLDKSSDGFFNAVFSLVAIKITAIMMTNSLFKGFPVESVKAIRELLECLSKQMKPLETEGA